MAGLRVRLAGERKLRAVPGKFPVEQARVQRDVIGCIFWDMHAVMHSVGGARGYQSHIDHSARSPGIPLVDGIAVGVDLQRAVEVRAFFYRAFAAIFDCAAPENCLPFVVDGFQFKPCVVSVDRATGKKMSDLFCAHDYIHAYSVAATQRRLNTVEGSSDGSNLPTGFGGYFALSFFADGERC